ncbi:MAG: DUF2911 domain-containing protein [Chitinophagaceae bacterium]|nr:DUF2911 domain-containing protein [Chitinophagaceae bacterium]
MGCLFFLLATALSAQIPEVDKSPLDFSYAPANYPILKFQGKQVPAAPLARVIYSRPQRNGRQLFGSEIKYGEIWRLGANETTEIEFFRNVNFAGKNISKGRFSLYCIPQADRWTIILNKDLHTWGAFSYKQSADAVRVNVPVTKTNGSMVEYFTMVFNESNHLVIQWSDVKVVVPIGYSGKLN